MMLEIILVIIAMVIWCTLLHYTIGDEDDD